MSNAIGIAAAGLVLVSMLSGVLTSACAPEPCTPADLTDGELGKLAEACQARVAHECGSPPAEDCPALLECDKLGEERCK